MMNTLIRIKLVLLVALCVVIQGTPGLAWCLDVGGASNTHIVLNNTDHSDDQRHSKNHNSNTTHLESTCEQHQNDCTDISFSPQIITTKNSTAINQVISKDSQAVTFLSMDWNLLYPAANGQFRPPFKSADHVNLQLASLQTIILLL